MLTRTQEKQLRFLDKLQPYEDLAYLRPYWVNCKNCGVSKQYYAASSARDFILEHRGHRTWLIVGRKTDSLKLMGW
jgi:predicted nucleic-acid-binding Zn-ribbon protein